MLLGVCASVSSLRLYLRMSKQMDIQNCAVYEKGPELHFPTTNFGVVLMVEIYGVQALECFKGSGGRS